MNIWFACEQTCAASKVLTKREISKLFSSVLLMNLAHFVLLLFLLRDNRKLWLNGGSRPMPEVYQELLVPLLSQISVRFLPCRYTINECPRCFGLLEARSR